MARSHARLQVAVWRNPDWVALTARAQWLYMVLLTQPKLTLVGSLDATPARWASLAQGVSREDVEGALAELAEARFVVVDDATDELIIRTFTAHDLDPNRVNVNLAKGLWGQWGCIASPLLRSVAVHEMPEPIWDKLEPHAPHDATQTRRSARLEPGEPSRSEPESEPRIEPPLSSLLPPLSTHRPANGRRFEPSVVMPPPVEQILADRPPIDRDLNLSSIRQLRDELHHEAS